MSAPLSPSIESRKKCTVQVRRLELVEAAIAVTTQDPPLICCIPKIGEHCTPIPQCAEIFRRIKTGCRKLANFSSPFATKCCAHRLRAIFDDKKLEFVA